MKRGGVRSQEVTDAQGRRRFHGAFTGGFSAGYYNSVGTEDGWTPRTFSSSRDNRSSDFQQRPEDLMDEEDDPLLGKRLETTERYDTLQTGAKRRLQQQQANQASAGAEAIPGFALPEDWVLPVNESVGAKLLKQMGWKEGHGIGQRVRRRKFQDETAVERPKLLMQDAAEEKKEMTLQGEAEEEVYVPPRKVFDVQKAFPIPKLDRYGAGFDPYTNAPEFSLYKQQQEEKQRAKEGTNRQVVSFLDALKSSSGSDHATTGYGLSALEENDDIDVYGTVSMQEFDRVIAPLGAKAGTKRLDSSAQESRRHENMRRSRALCSDGRSVLPGFELASLKEKPPKAVNLRLAVPSGFSAYHRFDEEEGHDDAATTLYRKFNFSTDTSSNGSVVTAKQRGVLLGDSLLGGQGDANTVAAAPDEAKSSIGSVFDLLGDEQKAKLFDAAAQAKRGLPVSRVMHPTVLDKTETPTARQPLVRGSGGDEFRATISASIAKRFVSSTSTADEETIEQASAAEPPSKVSRRSQSLWIPKSLLCKRFHVKCAGPTGATGKDDESEHRPDLFDKELVPHLVEFAADRAARRQPEEKTQEVLNPGAAVEAEHIDDGDLPPLPVAEKTSANLLKSIFEPSDESDLSEDESDDDSGEEKGEHQQVCHEGKQEAPSKLSLGGTPSSPRRGTSFGASVKSDRQRATSSGESSSSDGGISSPIEASGGGNVVAKRGSKRSHSADDADSHDARRQAKEDKRRRKKHKKHHKHRSSREDKDKKRKKKDKKDRKSHRSSRHSRRSRSRERSSSRHRSSNTRHE